MGKYLKLFETDSERVEYEGSEDYLEPYVSYVEGDNTVHYNKVETRLIATYNVTDASNPTQLYMYMNQQPTILGADMFDKVEIDGTEVAVADLDTAQGQYQLSADEHTVKYTLKDPTMIGLEMDEQTGMPSKIGATFANCPVTSVEIPDSVTSIGIMAFFFCSALTNATIGSGVTSIGNSVFVGCDNLVTITVDSNNRKYDSRNNCNAIIETATNTLTTGCKNTVIPNSVTSIGHGAFYGTTLTSITIPNSVTRIGSSAFEECTNLTGVTIPNSVTSIDNNAFFLCSALTSITIPDSVTNIGNGAFGNCDDLTSVTIEATTPPTLGNVAFDSSENFPIWVPAGTANIYKIAGGWIDYASRIHEIGEVTA